MFLMIITIFIWFIIFTSNPNNLLKIVFFNIGQGDSLFIETPNKRQVLVDGGPDNMVLEKLGSVLSFYDRYIDIIVLTHPDEDHLTGLVEVLNRFDVGLVFIGGADKDNATYQEWQRIIEEKNIKVKIAQMGQKIILDKDIDIKILWPDQNRKEYFADDTNNSSVVLQLDYKDAEFLLTGDIDKKIENVLVNSNQNLKSEILKVAHHGSKNSSSQNFINKVSPKMTIISVGENRYGHPHPDVLERLKNTLIYRTDLFGDVKILSDGFKIEVIN